MVRILRKCKMQKLKAQGQVLFKIRANKTNDNKTNRNKKASKKYLGTREIIHKHEP